MRTRLIFFITPLMLSVSYAQPLCDFQGRDSLVAVVVGDTIHLQDLAACGYCSATFNIWVQAVNDSIYIVQTDTAGQIALCDCLFNLRTSISGLPPGTYWIAVYRDLLKKYGYPSDIHQFIGSVQVAFQATSTPSFGWNTFQSQCLPDAVPPVRSPVPARFVLHQNYPNPFNPATTISFETTKSEFVKIKLYDLSGREVQTLWAESTPPGWHSVAIRMGERISSGAYYCRMDAGGFSQTVRIVLLR